MAIVRPYEPKDKENVREVCLATGPKNAYEPKERILLLACFCDYYIENEPENCFVVADDADNAVGYIFCARDAKTYYKRFKAKYVGQATKASVGKGIMARFTTVPVRFYAKKYPAGAKASVYYNPDQPDQATLEPGLARGDWMIPAVGIIAMAFGIFALFFSSY